MEKKKKGQKNSKAHDQSKVINMCQKQNSENKLRMFNIFLLKLTNKNGNLNPPAAPANQRIAMGDDESWEYK